ncbi:lysoplasmalogenase-like protein TMEM86A [Rhincodon typus]|uniref:lysoplasmalogenase-like protein TMEM86A n=1 Tax=Rhincodon typus TaxID=259920 RepID=UPI00202EBD2D|nr:lysoplasmalogenase-like protein TMEM86A [Rhincodon typus]
MEIYKFVIPFALALLLRFEFGLPERPLNSLKALFRVLPIIVLIAVVQEKHHGNEFSLRLSAGLSFSAAGDLCYLYRQQYIIIGIICFSIAYCLYALAFKLKNDNFLLACLACFIVIVVYHFMTPKLRGLRGPAAMVYMTTALLMIWRAMAWYRKSRKYNSLAALLGATLLVVSETVLSTHIFQFPVPQNELIGRYPYYLGQLFIALAALS